MCREVHDGTVGFYHDPGRHPRPQVLQLTPSSPCTILYLILSFIFSIFNPTSTKNYIIIVIKNGLHTPAMLQIQIQSYHQERHSQPKRRPQWHWRSLYSTLLNKIQYWVLTFQQWIPNSLSQTPLPAYSHLSTFVKWAGQPQGLQAAIPEEIPRFCKYWKS